MSFRSAKMQSGSPYDLRMIPSGQCNIIFASQDPRGTNAQVQISFSIYPPNAKLLAPYPLQLRTLLFVTWCDVIQPTAKSVVCRKIITDAQRIDGEVKMDDSKLTPLL